MEIINNKLKYFLHSPSAGDREVFPTGESALKVKYELHNEDTDPLYDYIVTVDGILTFAADDYVWIKAIEDDTAVRGEDLLLELQDKQTGTVWVEGTRIILNDATFDLDRCTVDIPITTPDPYEVFNAAKGDDINFFDLLISGTFYDINVLDYVPNFETNYSEIVPPGGTGTFGIGSQNFDYFPNSKAQYPGYGTEGEIPDANFPSTATTLFDNADLVDLTNNAVDGFVELNVGTKPYHNGYATPDLAIADGWRIYAFRYDIFANTGGGAVGYKGMFCWIREVKDEVIGTVMTPEWVYVGVIGGMDRWARKPLLVPRTNINRASFVTESFPTEKQVRIMQTTYVVGLDIVNIVAGSTYPLGSAPTDAIMDVFHDFEFRNYYAFGSLVNGKTLNDVIEFTIHRCDPSLTVVSDFFQINPGTVSTDNYVTGLPSYVDDIIMFQKSDVKRPFASNKATIGMYTANKLLTWLSMFDVKYRIEGTNFILEHITSPAFVRAATLNLTTPPLNERLAGLRRYSYDQRTRLPAKETFMFMEARPRGDTEPLNDFNGLPILYYGSNVDRTKDAGVLAHLIDAVTTDVYYIMIHSGGLGYLIDQTTKNPYPVQDAANDDTISDDGFVFVASNLDTSGPIAARYMFVKEPIIGTDREMNNVLGWAFLHRDFFMTNRNTKQGNLNGSDVTFTTTKYIKQSVELNFDMCNINDFDQFELIISALGTGIVKTAEYSIVDSSLTVVLGYQE